MKRINLKLSAAVLGTAAVAGVLLAPTAASADQGRGRPDFRRDVPNFRSAQAERWRDQRRECRDDLRDRRNDRRDDRRGDRRDDRRDARWDDRRDGRRDGNWSRFDRDANRFGFRR